MTSIIWTGRAQQRLKAAYDFLRCHDQDAAKAAIGKIRESVSALRQEPRLGRPVLELLHTDTRELIVPYV